MDIEINELIIEEDRPEHIAKHNVTVDEVLEVVFGDYAASSGKKGKVLIIGQTLSKRFITVVLGKRKEKNRYGLVTARDVKKKERLIYQEKSKGNQK